MNKNLDEVYITLLKAKEKIYEYTKNKVKNENWRPYYNGIVENIDNIMGKIPSKELIKDIGLKGVFESFNHVFDTVFGSWNGN